MRLLAFSLAVIVAFASFGINPADSVKVLFRVGQSQYDPALGENRQKMDGFLDKVRGAMADGNMDRIVVRGYASPDGLNSFNDRLAHDRCVSIADYIVANTGLNRNLVEEKSEGIAWGELRRMVAETPGVPSRDKILDILDNTPLWIFGKDGKITGGRKKQLMELQGGRPYNWMLVNLFPQLRNALGVMLCIKEEPQPVAPATDEKKNEPTPVVVPDSTETTPAPVEVENAEEIEERRHHFALKTNLLYDAALMPNLEFEWLINHNWSVGIEGDVAWWKPKETKVYRLAIISPEIRYHIKPRAPWQGMYAGVFAGGGLYQLQHGIKGYRGEGGMGGVSFGYTWLIGKHFFFEAGIGVGYLYTRYKVYEYMDSHRVYMRTKTLNYFGPLKLKLSIAWRFDIVNKTIKVKSPL